MHERDFPAGRFTTDVPPLFSWTSGDFSPVYDKNAEMTDFLAHVATHLALAGWALLSGVLLGGAIGYGAFRFGRIGNFSLSGLAALRVIPSIAVLALLIPWLGIGFAPAVAALSLLAAAPIALAVDAGLRTTAASVIESARALGLTERQILRRVRLPLALPFIFGGLRTAGVEVIASATLAAFVGGGGLGEYIIEGMADGNMAMMLVGAISIAVLAWLVEAACAGAGVLLVRRYAAV